MIEEYVEQSVYLKEELLPAYDTNRGQRIYQNTVELMQSKFPQYVRELQGISDGSQVPFHKVENELNLQLHRKMFDYHSCHSIS